MSIKKQSINVPTFSDENALIDEIVENLRLTYLPELVNICLDNESVVMFSERIVDEINKSLPDNRYGRCTYKNNFNIEYIEPSKCVVLDKIVFNIWFDDYDNAIKIRELNQNNQIFLQF